MVFFSWINLVLLFFNVLSKLERISSDLYTFLIITHRKTMNSRYRFKMSKQKCYIILNRFFLILCSLNTFFAFFYQFICKDYFTIRKSIQNSDNFFIKNLQNIGFTLYYKKNLYYKFIQNFIN